MHGLLQLMEFRCKLLHKICIPVRLSLTASVTVWVIVLGKPYFPRNFAFASYTSSMFIIPEGCCECVILSELSPETTRTCSKGYGKNANNNRFTDLADFTGYGRINIRLACSE